MKKYNENNDDTGKGAYGKVNVTKEVQKETAKTTTIVTARASEFDNTFEKERDPAVIMKYRGQQMIEDTIVKSTKVTVEFNPKRNVENFNVRTEILNVLNIMWETDKAIKVQSRETNEMWGPKDTFPAEDDFMMHFKINEIDTKYKTKKCTHISL